MTRKQRLAAVIGHFEATMPSPQTELTYGSPFQLLVAVMLSAQCTDRRVNTVTPSLFARFPSPQEMAKATPEEVLPFVSSVSYPNSKASHLVGAARMLVEDYGGEVPQGDEELLRLPGVGRKTANVVQAVLWGMARMPVDTHVLRVSHRLGLVPPSARTPLSVERELTMLIPSSMLPTAHHWLLLHGRYTCTSRRPHCKACPFATFCPEASRLRGALPKTAR